MKQNELQSELRKAKEQLEIAIEALRIYANEDYWLYCCKACGGSYFTLHKDKINLKYGEYPAKDALYKIKLKEKEND